MIARGWSRLSRLVSGRLRNKLILLFSAIAACIVILLSYLSYLQSAGLNRDNYIESNRKILKLVNQNLDGYLDRIDELSISPRKDAPFMDAIISKEYSSQAYIQNQLKTLFYSGEDIEEVSIYTPSAGQLYTMSRSFVNLRQEYTDRPAEQAWYSEALKSRRFRSIESGYGRVEVSERGYFLVFHRILINIADKKPLAAISITYNLKEVSRILQDISDKPGEFIGIFNESNDVFYVKGPPLNPENTESLLRLVPNDASDTGQKSLTIDGENYLAIYNVSPRNGWKLITLTPNRVLNEEASQARRINLLAGAGAVFVLVVFIVIAANAITGRLNRFSRQIGLLGEGNFDVQSKIEGSDEIAQLSRKYNQMVARINDLIAERYEMQLNERNARLIALEAQINPHFLYNSLQAISTEAIIGGMDTIQEMVDALASSLRYSIKEAETVRVREEISHIRNYALLQQARFGERLRLHIESDERSAEAWIPKMTLQILVENAIKHGLEQMTGDIDIRIVTEEAGGLLLIRVSDNGPGIAPDRLTHIRERLAVNQLEYREGIGLNNVNARIKLLFGPESRLEIDSKAGYGTEVTVTLPMREERPYVQSVDHR
ncbi:sensor histidine kinase [Cohnella faecalis]|uniref:sensor histidine kinase n=1 Tax=Cohnella faecalis TaxID=2315694 RepID=UPI0013143C43|nr:histidine kinase [Cohnella faecalis]